MKITFIKSTGALACLGITLASAAPVLADSATYSPNVVIPDFNLNGIADTETFSTAIQSISDLTVNLQISGGYDGDFYAYLTHDGTGFAVLLNRIGVTSSSPFGSDDTGMNITLNDAAASNVHDASANGGVLTGTFKPDGRNVSPLAPAGALDATPSTTPLSSFDGMDPNGSWTLFIADTSPVGIGTLESWSLNIDGTTGTTGVPDSSSTLGLLTIGAGFLAALKRRTVG
jgi:subtilisin-like proprotein convertase family protein